MVVSPAVFLIDATFLPNDCQTTTDIHSRLVVRSVEREGERASETGAGDFSLVVKRKAEKPTGYDVLCMARREGGDPAFGQGQKRGEEMIVNEPVNPLIKYSKPVSSLTSVGRRKGLYDRNGSWRGRKEGSLQKGAKGLRSSAPHELRKKGRGP